MARATRVDQSRIANFVKEIGYLMHISCTTITSSFPVAIFMDKIMKNPQKGLKSAGKWGLSDEMVEALEGLGVNVKFNF